MNVYDKIGQPVKVGDYIAYGHALGRCAGLRIGRILSLKVIPPTTVTEWNRNPRPEYRAVVCSIDDDWDTREPECNKNTGTLQFPNRWIVLPDGKVPRAYRRMLNEFAEKWVPPTPKVKK